MTLAAFVDACWARAAEGLEDEDDREKIQGPGLVAEVYSACDLVRLSFTGARMRLTPEALKTLESLEKEHGLTREVRAEPDASGDFNFILNKGEKYAARLTPEKLLLEPLACGRELGLGLLGLYEGSRKAT